MTPDSEMLDSDAAQVSPDATESERLKAELEAANNQYLRLAADFDNFRKRQAQERESLLKYGAQSTLAAMLPVIDNLMLAQKSLSPDSPPDVLFKSFDMLASQLLESLKASGLSSMNSQGATFDPEHHEAISMVPHESLPEHTIVDVYKEGYLIHDRVLRPAQVVVSSGNGADSPVSSSNFDPSAVEGKQNPFTSAEESASQEPS